MIGIKDINYKVMDNMDNAVILEDLNTSEIIFINRQAKKLLKTTSNLSDIKTIKDLIGDETAYNEIRENISKDMQEYKKSESVTHLKTLDNKFIEIKFVCTWLSESERILCYTFKKAIEVFGESKVNFKELAEQLPSGIIVMDVEHELSITYANSEHYKILGIKESNENKHYLLKNFIFEEDIQWVLSEIYINIANNEDVDIEFRMKTQDNVIKWVRLFGRGNISASGEKLFYSSLKDLSERRSIHDKLHMERVLFHKITEITDEILFRLDLKTNIINFLGTKSHLFGDNNIFENYPESLLRLNKVHAEDVVAHTDLIYCFQNGIEKPVELRYKVDEEENLYEWYRITYSFIKEDDGTPISAIGKLVNINTQKLLEERAKTDLLTGFYNKITTEQEVDRLIEYKKENSLAFFIIDIDDFKSINDNLGHHFGDMVLTGIAEDLKSCFRQNDILGRIGGDEFVIVMRDMGDTSVIVQKAELICSMLNKTFSGGTNNNYTISASIGISMYPSDGNNFNELYRKSDMALYEIKENGKNGYKQYFNDLERKNISKYPRKHEEKRIASVLINNNVVTTVLNLLYESKDLNLTIFLILEYLGKTFKLDKCYIFETLDENKTYCDNYRWHKDDDTYNKEITQNLDKENIDKVLQNTDEDGIFYTNDISTIGDEWVVKVLESASVKSIFLVDSKEKYDRHGILFIEDCKTKRVWSEEEVVTLLHTSRLIFNALNFNYKNAISTEDIKDIEINKNAISIIDNATESLSIPMAVVDRKTFEVIYNNDLYYDVFSDAEIKDIYSEIAEEIEKNGEYSINSKICDNQWVKKALPLTLYDGREVYMIYAKDGYDYIDPINAVDKVTKSLMLVGFEEYYRKIIKNSDTKYALCTLDIDKFKYINEMFGYATGDDVLRNTAKVIRNYISEEENFCRIGEDKFAIFLSYADEFKLHMKISELSEKFERMRDEHFKDIKITIVGGITLIDTKFNLNTILDQSTIARKSAKGSHKNTFSYYDPEIDLKIRKELKLEEQIPHAVANDEFVPYLQPKFDIVTKKICGAEALVRWITPNGMIFPDQFIPLFERNGFILVLDFIIYEKVMQYIRKCLDNGLPVYPISVNVSRNHIKDRHFLDKFMDLISKYKIPHECLELEITESVFVEDKSELKQFIDGIKDYKLKVSIDDFGTAYSSLQNLTDVNVDILKIDKGFLDNIDSSKNIVTKDEILIKNIINLAKELDFHVICEGVETDEQIELLKKVGCEYGQGYVFARPMPIDEYEKKFLTI